MNLDLNTTLVPLALFLVILILFFSILLLIQGLRAKGRVSRSLNMTLFLVTLPKEKAKEGELQKTEKETISVMEQLYASLANIEERGWLSKFLYGSPHLVFEIATPEVGEEIGFYIALPRRYKDILEKQIHGFFPYASIEQVEDYNIFNPNGQTAGGYMRSAISYILPFKTYQNLEADPLNEITTTLSKLAPEGEGAALQILIRPVSGWQEYGLKTAKEMQKGTSYETAKLRAGWGPFRRTFDLFLDALRGEEKKKKTDVEAQTKEKTITPLQEEVIKAIEGKTSKTGFETNIRILTSAASQARAEEILRHLEGAFRQFDAPNLNRLKLRRVKRRALKKLIYNFSFRNFNPKQTSILNTEELTSLFHFPTRFIETPKVKMLKAKPAAPPANLPKEGLILGRNIFRGEETIVRLLRDDRRRHLYVVGQTGTGKSAFLQEMIRQDIENGEGVAVVDPHGDLIEAVLANIPEKRTKDVIVFDPADLERPIGLNMLEYKTEEQKDTAVAEMINIFHKLFPPEYVGPMCEHYFRNAMLTLMADRENPGTVAEIPRILTDDDFIKERVAMVKDPVVRSFWEKEWARITEQTKSEMLGYLISKIGAFVENEMMRNIIGQSRSSFDFRQVMDNQKILLVNLSKGKLGELNSALLGLIIVSKLQMGAMARVDTEQEQRKDFYLYVDEFQNFTTDSIATILAEARKYRLNLTIAHQFIAQLEEKIKDAVIGNVGSMVSFRVGAEDAEFLAKQFEPIFNESDLINIDNFNAYIKLMINNETSNPFNILTYPPSKGSLEMVKKVKELSRQQYGRDKEEVKKEILERTKLGASSQTNPTISGEKE